MKQSAKVLGCLALMPLLGLFLAGCGSDFLGDVDGSNASFEGGVTRPITLTGQAFVEQDVRSRQAQDAAVSKGTVQIRRYTASGQAVDVPGVTGTLATDTAGRFAVTITVDQKSQDALWVVEVFGTVAGVEDRVLLSAVFIPGFRSSVTVNVDVASTLLAASIATGTGSGTQTGTLTDADIQRTVSQLQGQIRSGVTLVPKASLPTGADASEARQDVAGLANPLVDAYNSLVAELQILDTSTTPPTVVAPSASPLELVGTRRLAGIALDRDGNPLAVGLEFFIQKQTPSAVIKLQPAQIANQVDVTANARGSADLVARIAVPGTPDKTRKSVLLGILTLGHEQGQGIGG